MLVQKRLFERYLAQSRLQSTEGERDRQSGSSPQRGPRGPAMATERKPMPKWKIDTIEAAIQDLQRLKVPITASRIHKRTGPSVTLDEIRHYAAHRFGDPKD